MQTALAVYPELDAYVEAQWRSHLADDFAALAHTPCGPLHAFIAAFRDDPSFYTIDAFMRIARGVAEEAERRRFYSVLGGGGPLMGATGPVFLRKAFLAEAVRRAPDEATREALAAELASLAGVDTPKAAEVRRPLNGALKELIGQKLVSSGGGEWTATFAMNATPIRLWVDMGGMSRGFRYELWPPSRPGWNAPTRFNYEVLLGLPSFGWDALRTDRLEAHIALWASRMREMLGAMKDVRWDEAARAA